MLGERQILECGGKRSATALLHPQRAVSPVGCHRTPEHSAFTLIELLVVLSLILIITGVAISSVSGLGSPKQQLRREARSLMGLLSEARRTAMVRKMNVDVYVDESSRTVCAIESGHARQLLSTGEFSDRLLDLTEESINSNRFFRTVSFPEEFSLEAFGADEIDAEGGDGFFQPEISVDEEQPNDVLALSFTHFGGASGGGVSLSRGGVRLDIACDILTGRASPVKRRGEME